MISEVEIIIRLIVAAALGAAVGLERERHNQPAGLRTHIILVVGSALAMTLSINLAIQFRPLVPNGDPARLAAQVISGIGFLGAGAIMRYGPNIKGLTTATSLWAMAVIGLAVGAGYYLTGAAATALLLISLVILNFIEHRYIHAYLTMNLSIKADDRPRLIDDIKRELSKEGTTITAISIKKNLEDKRIVVDMVFKIMENVPLDPLIADLSNIKGVRSFQIN